MNKHARMSTVDRVVELAVRNDVRVPGLAALGRDRARAPGAALAADAEEEADTLFSTAIAEPIPRSSTR